MCKCFIFSIDIVGKNKYSVRGEALFIPTNVAQWWIKQKTICGAHTAATVVTSTGGVAYFFSMGTE